MLRHMRRTSSGLRLEFERGGVDAITLAGGTGAVVEDVPEMTAAAPARDLGAHHAVSAVFVQLDRLGNGRLGEARPAGAGLELGLRAEQRRAARSAPVHPVVLRVRVL